MKIAHIRSNKTNPHVDVDQTLQEVSNDIRKLKEGFSQKDAALVIATRDYDYMINCHVKSVKLPAQMLAKKRMEEIIDLSGHQGPKIRAALSSLESNVASVTKNLKSKSTYSAHL